MRRACLALLLAACSSTDPTSAVTETPEPILGRPHCVDKIAEPASGLSRATSGAPTADRDQLAAGINAFAFELHRWTAQQPLNAKKNLFASPYSISAALGMTYAGARGT